MKTAEKCFDFAASAKEAFETGTSEAKSNIISALGSNLTLKDKILSIHWAIPFDTIKSLVEVEKNVSSRLEPQKSLLSQEQIEEIYSTSSEMLPDKEPLPLHGLYTFWIFLFVPPELSQKLFESLSG